MDDKANEVRLRISGVVSLFSDRHLNEMDPICPLRVAVLARVLDAYLPIQGQAPVMAADRFLYQIITEAMQVKR